MKRIIGHWTGGGGRASSTDKKHYHRLVEYDGNIVAGTEAIEDNVVTSDGDYAAHTRNLNTDSIGIAMCGMADAQESPFDPGPSPLTEKQFNAFCVLVADQCRAYAIPVTRETVLFHAEVEPTLGVKQRGKWDVTRLVFLPDVVGALPVGDYMRDRVRLYLGDNLPSQSDGLPTLRMGSRGQRLHIQSLQTDLADLGYHVGSIDGVFGQRTRAAVAAFQVENGLMADGVVGPMTWAALDKAVPLPQRDVTEEDLLARGSKTVATAKRGHQAMTAVESTVGGAFTVGGALEIASAAQKSEGAIEAANRIVTSYWPLLIVGGVLFFLARYGKKLFSAVTASRVKDARSGAHMGR